jgi:hypothetical protein
MGVAFTRPRKTLWWKGTVNPAFFIGKTLETVRRECPEMCIRVAATISAEGVSTAHDQLMDYRPHRINVTLDSGNVIRNIRLY